MSQRILVIRLGALGDFFLSFPAFADIRAHHAGDHVALLTTAPFADLAQASPWFDSVRIDTRPSWLNLPALWRLRARLRGFDMVYDMQTSRRSSRYFRLAGRPPWSGIARGCAFPDPDPNRDARHTLDRQRGQLAGAGVPPSGGYDLSWLSGGGPSLAERYGLAGRYALLVPATSGSHGGAKTWPIARYAALATTIAACGVRPVVVGTAAEAPAAATIRAACPTALDLTGQTTIPELAGLASRAALAVGGDTGPIHVAGVMGAPVVALFSRFSDVTQAAPLRAVVIRAERVDEIGVGRVEEESKKVLLF